MIFIRTKQLLSCTTAQCVELQEMIQSWLIKTDQSLVLASSWPRLIHFKSSGTIATPMLIKEIQARLLSVCPTTSLAFRDLFTLAVCVTAVSTVSAERMKLMVQWPFVFLRLLSIRAVVALTGSVVSNINTSKTLVVLAFGAIQMTMIRWFWNGPVELGITEQPVYQYLAKASPTAPLQRQQIPITLCVHQLTPAGWQPAVTPFLFSASLAVLSSTVSTNVWTIRAMPLQLVLTRLPASHALVRWPTPETVSLVLRLC